MHFFLTLHDFLAEANAYDRYAFIASSNNDGVFIYHKLISSVCLHFHICIRCLNLYLNCAVFIPDVFLFVFFFFIIFITL